MKRRLLVLVALLGGDALVLALLSPDPGELAGHVAHPRDWISQVGVDRALAELAGTALWFVALWLGVGFVAALAGSLPGIAGRWGRTAGRALLPRTVRALLAGSAGVGVLLTPVASGAAPPPTAPATAAPSTSAPAAIPAPTWPTSPAERPPRPVPPVPASSSLPAPIWPSAPAPPPASATTASPSRPAPSTPPARTPPSRQQPAKPDATAPDGAAVAVRPGDCLWLIASRRLGPRASGRDVAAEWPRWYAANHDVIGPDPALVRPGQVLHAPNPTTSPEEATR